MGNRVSIQFENKDEKSVVLFSHWGGEDLRDDAEEYVNKLKNKILKSKTLSSFPLGRLQPQTVMVDFVANNLPNKEDPIMGDYYFGFSEKDGDNSDNGHFIIKLD